MAKTQAELVMSQLARAKHGMTALELHEEMDIPKNSLKTLLWGLKREGLIEQIGGKRGSYRYGLTDRGQTELVRAGIGQLYAEHDDVDLSEFEYFFAHQEDYKKLMGFWNWLMEQEVELIQDDREPLVVLYDAIHEYLGIDRDALDLEMRALQELIEERSQHTKRLNRKAKE